MCLHLYVVGCSLCVLLRFCAFFERCLMRLRADGQADIAFPDTPSGVVTPLVNLQIFSFVLGLLRDNEAVPIFSANPYLFYR